MHLKSKLISIIFCTSISFSVYAQLADEIIRMEVEAKSTQNIQKLNEIGLFYQNGLGGVNKDVAKAIELYQIGVSKNDPESLFHMGNIYYQGVHGRKDFFEAIKWFKKSADLGYAQALFHIGNIYEFERGDISQDTSKALNLYEQAAAKGFYFAYSYLGKIYEEGRFVNKDYNQAAEWYIKGIQNSSEYDTYAHGCLIKLLNLNLVTDSKVLNQIKNLRNFDQNKIIKENKKMLDNFLALAKKGDTNAMVMVSTIFSQGVAEPFDAEKKQFWLEKAALLGNSTAAWTLGFNAAHGVDQSINYDEAIKWYVKAYQLAVDANEKSHALAGLDRLLDNGVVITQSDLIKQIAQIYGQSPQLAWLEEPQSNLSDNKLKLKFSAKNAGYGVGDTRIFINDTVVYFNAVKADSANTQQLIEQSFELDLPEGEHDIRVEVYNAKNRGEPSILSTKVNALDKTLNKPKLHALIVGINDYSEHELRLNYAKSDAKLIENLLKKQVGKNYLKGEIKVLLSTQETTKQSILSQLNQLKQKVSYGDVFVFYFAGHGTVVMQDGYYMLPSDVKLNFKGSFQESSLSSAQIRNALAQIPTSQKLIILDTCNSGGALDADQLRFNQVENQELLVEGMRKKSGATIFMASSSTQQAMEGYQGHGVFTYTLAQSIAAQNDLDNNGVIDTNEIAEYLNQKVPQITEEIFKKEQVPVYSLSGAKIAFNAN